MQYLIVFLEGIVTFISPCLLPLLPLYLIYFSGSDINSSKKTVLRNTLGFVLGFTIVFVILGTFASTLGIALRRHQRIVDLVAGIIIILFGINFTGLINLKFLNSSKLSSNKSFKPKGFFSSILFGIVFSISWTPCLTAFLGTALLLASKQETIIQGVIMLLLYSLGLAIPFILSSLLIEKLKTTLDFIKRNFKTISVVCGILLIILGIIMASGNFGVLLSKLGG